MHQTMVTSDIYSHIDIFGYIDIFLVEVVFQLL